MGDSNGSASPVRRSDSNGSGTTAFSVRITGRDVHQDGSGKDFVLYKHEATRDGEKHVILSRFSRFAWLDQQARAAYKGNHLLSSIPPFPKKQWKLMVDHMSDEFLGERQAQLEYYLQTLARMPGIDKVEAFELFITTNATPSQQVVDNNIVGTGSDATADDDDERVGFLAKQGYKNKSFRRRWFRLSKNGRLQYYKHPQDSAPKGNIMLDKFVAVRKVESVLPMPHSLQIITQARVYLLAADTDELRDQWFDALSKFTAKPVEPPASRAHTIYDSFV